MTRRFVSQASPWSWNETKNRCSQLHLDLYKIRVIIALDGQEKMLKDVDCNPLTTRSPGC